MHAISQYLAIVSLAAASLCAVLFLWERHKRLRMARAMATLREKARMFQLVAENASDGLLVQRMTSEIVWANKAYSEIFGYDAEDLVGRYPLEFVMPPDLAVSQEEARSFNYADHMHEFDSLVQTRNVRHDGEEFYNQLNLSLVEVEQDGEETQLVVASCRDVTDQVSHDIELRQALGALLKVARHDNLTGLANRAWFNERLQKVLVEAAREGRQVALCQIDLDRFKEVNDTLGHPAGDAVLCHVADALSAHQSEGVMAGRIGGDEFCFFMIDPADLNDVATEARRLQREIAAPLKWEAGTIATTATIGIAISNPAETDMDSLVKRADFALYSAKTKQRGTVGVFDSKLRAKYERHRRIREDLATTIDQGALTYNFQPIVSLGNGGGLSFETLVRWSHPEYGPIAPDVFLPLAREMGRMPEVDFFGARAALRLLADLDAAGHNKIIAGVNISSETLLEPMFLDFVLWEAERNGIDHRRLHLEILETVFFSAGEQVDEAADAVTRLKSEGFSVVLDDFGVGHAGLAHLASLNVDGIKIDRSLIAPLPDDPQSLVIVESIVALAEKLNLSVVAEGLETQVQIACLRGLGCEAFQGFGLSRPMRPEDVIPWVNRHPSPASLVIGGRARAG